MKLIQLGGHRSGSAIQGWAKVDDADYAHLSQWNWSLIDGYVTRAQWLPAERRRVMVRMHRVLLGLVPGDGLQIDHINRDKLDNQRENLRVVTQAENNHNMPLRGGASRHRGVRRSRERWQAYVMAEGKFNHLGCYDDEDVAAEIARAARLSLLAGAVD